MVKAVVLAAGLGTRLRAEVTGVELSPPQARVAATGVKPLVPIHGRSFIEYQLEELSRAGVDEICVVVAERHEELWRSLAARGLELAVQTEPRGTADALLAAESFAAGEPFLMLNGDTWYAAGVLAALAALRGPGVAGFDRRRLADSPASNITAERIAGFAVLATDGSRLLRVIEKPHAGTLARHAGAAVGVNAWCFSRSIFDACRAVGPSPRGELELTAAVQWAIDRADTVFRVVRSETPVLDLSTRRDVARIERLLRPLASGAVTC